MVETVRGESVRDVTWYRPDGNDPRVQRRLRELELRIAEQERATLELAEQVLVAELRIRMREARVLEREERLLARQEAAPSWLLLWAGGLAISLTASFLVRRYERSPSR